MVNFILNGEKISLEIKEDISLLEYLRLIKGIISVKDGCSGQATCGACMVEINGEAKLSCTTKISSLNGKIITTTEGIPEPIKKILGDAFVGKGAVQCGFCTPGFLMRTKVLLQKNPLPSRQEIAHALTLNLCRCTGFVKIIDAIEAASISLKENKTIKTPEYTGKVGTFLPKYQSYETAIGTRPFVDDLKFEGMLLAALKFSDHPRAKVLKIDLSKALELDGVIKVFTAKDIPGNHQIGLIFKDWSLMIDEGETTHYIGDVIAGVVAINEKIARNAVSLIHVEYEILEPVTDPYKALEKESPCVHDNSNLLENCVIRRGEFEKSFKNAAYTANGFFQTQRIEHAFLETETAVAMPNEIGGIKIYSQGQGVYVDRKQISELLSLPEEKVEVVLVPNGGGFGGKEDMTVQGHVSLFAFLLQKTVKLHLSREESITMHPKRHPVFMDMALCCDNKGKLSAIKLRAVGDSGAYASVGTKVLERVAGHATGGYFVPAADIEAKTIYTNNIPSGAMRGFGANQVAFALETLIDELCEKGNFDRWQFRYDNALVEGLSTSTGQILKGGVGIRETLLAVKDEFYKAKYAGLACGIKNSGVGNGMADFSDVKIKIISEEKILIEHGWTEMGQGIHTIAIQTLCEETGINPDFIEVKVETSAGIVTGMTTSSRATALLGNAIIDAAKTLKKDLETKGLKNIIGNTYTGRWICDWTTKPGADVKEIITHYSYGYATQLVVLNNEGEIDTVFAAHDAGKIMNPIMFEGQIEGAVHMGLGYALSENLPMENGRLKSTKLKDCGIIRAKDLPKIKVIGVEKKDPVGPYGAKGIGEIGLVPTAAAVANAFYQFDKIRRYQLPLKRK